MNIKELAEQAGYLPDMFGNEHWDMQACKRFAELVAAAEREACARLCDDLAEGLVGDDVDGAWGAGHCAGAIEARGDMSTKPQNVDTSEERVHKSDKSIHDDDDIQEYKKPWVGLSDTEAEIYGNQFSGTRLVKAIEALLKKRNT